MKNIFYEGQVIWSMIDANGHLRHSAYADFAAQARVNILEQAGLAAQLFQNKIGPILFREELVYFKEIRMNELIRVSVELTRCREDGSRYSLQSIIYKQDGIKSAEVNVDGAWLDLSQRKLTALPPELEHAFIAMPKASNFITEPVVY